MRGSVLILIFSIVAISLFSQGGIHFHTKSFQAAKKIAKKENKIIFVDAYTDWCKPCKWMDQNVFTDDKVGDFYNTHFVNLKINIEEGKGILIKKKYDITYFPTYLFLDENAKILHKVYGAKSAEEFIESGLMALNPEMRLSRFLDSPESSFSNPDFLFEFAIMLKKSGDPNSGSIAERYLNTQDDWTKIQNLQIIYDFSGADLESELVKYLLVNRQEFFHAVSQELVNNKIRNILIINAPPDQTYVDILDYIDSNLLADESMFFKGIELTLLSSATDLMQYKSEYLTMANTYFVKFGFTDAQLANNVAWNIAELSNNKEQLLLASKIAKYATDHAPGYYNHDTMATICFKLGKLDEAKAYAERAIGFAVSNNINAKSTVILLDKINKSNH